MTTDEVSRFVAEHPLDPGQDVEDIRDAFRTAPFVAVQVDAYGDGRHWYTPCDGPEDVARILEAERGADRGWLLVTVIRTEDGARLQPRISVRLVEE